MGAAHSSIEFEDNYTASDVSLRQRIKCTRSCTFTQYTKKELATNDEISISCKVYESELERVAFGLVPVQSLDGCCRNMLGDREIYGSVGCLVTRSDVSLVKGGRKFFEGSFSSGSSYVITMLIRNGTLIFFVNGSKVKSRELEGMAFNGSCKLGVSMVRAGQEAEVYLDCPVTFKDIWSAGDVTREVLTAKASTNFTFYSEQTITPQGRHRIVANILRNQNDSVGLGVVPMDCKELCKNNLVGMKPGMIGCFFNNKTIFIAINGDIVHVSKVNTRDPCLLAMTIKSGQVSFEFDGDDVKCDRLKSVHLTENFRIGVGMSAVGQVVEMRGDGRLIQAAEENDSSDGDEKADLVEKLAKLANIFKEVLKDDPESLTWRDNMRSIDCDNSDIVAVCVKRFTATLYTKCVISADGQNSIDILIVGLKKGQLMMVGVMDEDTENHQSNHLGATEMRNSLGLTSRGDLLIRGSTRWTGRGFCQGDVISLSLKSGNMSIKVNGIEAIPELGNFNFSSKFRWAVSFTDVGQAVKIGRDNLTSEEVRFCQSKGARPNSPSSTMHSSSSSSLPSVIQSLYETPASSISSVPTTRTAGSFGDAIEGCYIDPEDIDFSGRPLGKGSFGTVYKGKRESHDVAIKMLKWEDDDTQRREIAIGRSLDHPNIATISGWSKEDDSLLVVMPLFKRGSLADCVDRIDKNVSPIPTKGGHFGWKFFFKIALGLLRAIKYMSSRKPEPLIHRDIKPANVLIDDNDEPKLTDFGTARSVKSTMAMAVTECGTPLYWAPEQATTGAGATTATDVCAVSLIIYEVICVPHTARKSTDMPSLFDEIRSGTVPQMDNIPHDIAHVLRPAFSVNPLKRPSAKDMIKSFTEFFSVYNSS